MHYIMRKKETTKRAHQTKSIGDMIIYMNLSGQSKMSELYAKLIDYSLRPFLVVYFGESNFLSEPSYFTLKTLSFQYKILKFSVKTNSKIFGAPLFLNYWC